MQNTLTFQFPSQDIQPRNASDELLSMLALCTGSLWRMTSDGDAQEIMAPFRRAHFRIEVEGAWQSYQAGAPLPPCVRAEFDEVRPDEVLSALRSTLDLSQESVKRQDYSFFGARRSPENQVTG